MIKISKVEFDGDVMAVRYLKPGESSSEIAIIREIVIAYSHNAEAINLVAEQISAIVLDAEDELYDPGD